MKRNTTKDLDKEKRSQIAEAIKFLIREKGLDENEIKNTLQRALEAAYRKNSHELELPKIYKANIDMQTGEIKILANKTVVETLEDKANQILLEEAQKVHSAYQVGDILEVDVTPKSFLRTAAQTAKQVIIQDLRETENGRIEQEYSEKENDILTGIVVDKVDGAYILELGNTKGILEASECVPSEEFKIDEHIKVYLLSVIRRDKILSYRKYLNIESKSDITVKVSRVHPGLIKRLFENAVPEIATGVVQIKSIAREAGSRTKIAVHSTEVNVDPVGACVGPRGLRVDNVVNEIRNEKIDIIKWAENPAEYIANSLNPAHVLSVYITDEEKSCRVIVPDSQLSLAIGKEGQNARLAAKLTGWKIDIKSVSQASSLDDMAGIEPIEFNRSGGITNGNYKTTSFIMDSFEEDIDELEDDTI